MSGSLCHSHRSIIHSLVRSHSGRSLKLISAGEVGTFQLAAIVKRPASFSLQRTPPGLLARLAKARAIFQGCRSCRSQELQ